MTLTRRWIVLIILVIAMMAGFGVLFLMVSKWLPSLLLAIIGFVLFIVLTYVFTRTVVEVEREEKSDWLNTLGLRETAQIQYPKENS